MDFAKRIEMAVVKCSGTGIKNEGDAQSSCKYRGMKLTTTGKTCLRSNVTVSSSMASC